MSQSRPPPTVELVAAKSAALRRNSRRLRYRCSGVIEEEGGAFPMSVIGSREDLGTRRQGLHGRAAALDGIAVERLANDLGKVAGAH